MGIFRAHHAEGFYLPHTEDEKVVILEQTMMGGYTLEGIEHSGDPAEWTNVIKHDYHPMVTQTGEIRFSVEPTQKVLAPSGCKHRECAMILEFGLN